jgi:hypothetical protein
MRNFIYATLIILLTGACNTDTRKKPDSSSVITDTVRVASIPEFVDSVKYFKTRRDNTRLKVINLRKLISAQQTDLKKKLDLLDSKFIDLDKKLENLESSTIENWKILRNEVDSILRSLEQETDSAERLSN